MKPDEKWLEEIPTNEEECMQALERDDALLQSNIQGLFQCSLKRGRTLLEAYEKALLASIPA